MGIINKITHKIIYWCFLYYNTYNIMLLFSDSNSEQKNAILAEERRPIHLTSYINKLINIIDDFLVGWNCMCIIVNPRSHNYTMDHINYDNRHFVSLLGQFQQYTYFVFRKAAYTVQQPWGKFGKISQVNV